MAKRQVTTWSHEIIERARQLRSMGTPTRRIARELNVPESTLRGWFKA